MTIMHPGRDFALPTRWSQLVDLGFSVFPVEHGGKKPLGKWKQYQTERADFDTVRKWASRESNIGIATGAVSGLIVLDLDTAEAVAEAEAMGIPDTLTARTGKGQHVYFQHPGFTLGNRAGVRTGWDIRGDGGYVVAPGSLHPSGAEYAWHNPPGLFELAPMPEWLLSLLDRTIEREVGKVRKAPAGTRNDQLNRAAFKLGQDAEAGRIDHGAAQEQLRHAAYAAGLDGDEIDATLASGFGAGQRNPKRKEPSEDDVALAFTAVHRDRLRFDHDQGVWFEWDGARWRRDGKHRAFTYARIIGRKMEAAGKANFAAGVERFARADEAHAVNADVWDTDPMLLGTPAGTIDLGAGKLRAARHNDYITKQTAVAPESGEPTRWLAFLRESLSADEETIRFLQQWCGYCLTGLTSEHALFFIYGPGGNGKSVFLNTIAAILGDYAVTAAMETFTASKFERHSTELAMLAAARMVTASETEEGRAWAEAKVKQMTGGDPVTARYMRQDNFTFRPQFKLTIAGNHAPTLRNVDDAMKRRFNIVPFTVKPANPDRQLEEKLRAEHGKILAWAIKGCLDWQAHGLVRPAAVTEATGDYFENQDLVGQWIADCCETGIGKWEPRTPLYNSWCAYARDAGEDPGAATSFYEGLNKRGFPAKRTGVKGRFHENIAIQRSTGDRSDS